MVADAIRGDVRVLREDGEQPLADKPGVSIDTLRSTEAMVYKVTIEEPAQVA